MLHSVAYKATLRFFGSWQYHIAAREKQKNRTGFAGAISIWNY